MSREFFEQVADALVGLLPVELGPCSTQLTSGNIKVWFGDEKREHYEAQFLRDGRFEIGFHSEHRAAERNEALVSRLSEAEDEWHELLGDDTTAGQFVGGESSPWRRLSEVDTAPRTLDVDAALEVADRLVAYAEALEPIRRTVRTA